MPQKTCKILEKAIHCNDIRTFHSTLRTANNLHVDYQDYDLLMKALRFARKRITRILLDNGCHAVKPSVTNGCTTPLHIVVSRIGWSTITKKLLARGARVDICDENGNTPIHVAFLSGAAGSVIDFLLKCYIEKTLLDIVDRDGLGLLHIACTRPYLDIIRAFVDIGGSNIFSQVSLQSNSSYAGYTALHFAVENGRHRVAKCLCKYEADVGVSNGKNSTPLHLAIAGRDVKMIDVLLHYADWNNNCIDSYGLSHFMAACASSDPEIVRQFLRIATDTSADALINVISACVKDIDDYCFAGYTPMHFAAEFGRLGTMQLLIERGAHCTTTKQNISPLDLARERNHESISALLQRHCIECKMCKIFVPEIETVFVDVMSNQTTEKPTIYRFNSMDNQVIDECCFLDIFPLPEWRGDGKGDCELCKVQEMLLIDNCENHFREDDFNGNDMKKKCMKNNKIRDLRVNCELFEYFFNGRNFNILITMAACVYIVTCIIFTSMYTFTSKE